ncbi:MAG: hypothetical protein ABID38_00755 [Candidatus Diapherotrites archaeon]
MANPHKKPAKRIGPFGRMGRAMHHAGKSSESISRIEKMANVITEERPFDVERKNAEVNNIICQSEMTREFLEEAAKPIRMSSEKRAAIQRLSKSLAGKVHIDNFSGHVFSPMMLRFHNPEIANARLLGKGTISKILKNLELFEIFFRSVDIKTMEGHSIARGAGNAIHLIRELSSRMD